jgi:hypothetical protein
VHRASLDLSTEHLQVCKYPSNISNILYMADCPGEDGPILKLLQPIKMEENNHIAFNILDIIFRKKRIIHPRYKKIIT